jgi:hypothetical protein
MYVIISSSISQELYASLLCNCLHKAPEIDFWINLRRSIKSRELTVRIFGKLQLNSQQCISFMGAALCIDLALLITLFVRLIILGMINTSTSYRHHAYDCVDLWIDGAWDTLDMMAFYDAVVVSIMLVYFLSTVVAMNEETQRVHLQILEGQRYIIQNDEPILDLCLVTEHASADM